MSCELTKDSLIFSKIETESHSVVIKVKDFSNETIHKSGKPVDIQKSIFQFMVKFFVKLYANGMTSEDKGYVTVEFASFLLKVSPIYKTFECSCVFSAIDASGNKRFPQSYVFNDSSRTKIFDRLLKREFLLSDPDDLLPGDCLSLHIDVEYRTMTDHRPHFRTFVEDVVHRSFPVEETDDELNYCLDLDSEVAKRLAEVSEYFQRMLETPMVEMETRRMNFPLDEFSSLMDICRIVMGAEEIEVSSIGHICELYVTADKYGIPIAVGSCRDLLTTLLGVEDHPAVSQHVRENIPDLLSLTETYNDARLKENIESFLKNDREYNGCTQKRLQNNLVTEWKFESLFESQSIYTFTRNVDEKPWVNFYK